MSQLRKFTIIIHPDTFAQCAEQVVEVILVGHEGRPDGDPRFLLASIKDLQLDVATQLRWMELGINPEAGVYGFGLDGREIVWVQEGGFKWDPDRMNYVPVEV